MSKILLVFIIFSKILIPMQASKRCDFGECNHEGQCYEDNHEKSCSCIGTKYFMGPKCSEAVDNCQNENPCKNGGKCKNIVGQFICDDCNPGFGGLWCDLQVSDFLEKMLLYFNHYAFYGQTHQFLITVETLGANAFSVEFTSSNYAIDSFETKPEQANKWIYSQNLTNIIEKLGIKYYQDLPYLKGYYHIASETFWDVGLLELSLSCYDTESATQLLYENDFDLLLIERKEECAPHIRFIHGTNPLEPLMLDIASYNNFEIMLKSRCFENSQIVYHWSVYNSIGTVKLHDFGTTSELILKVHPYKLWFKYQGEVMSSYRLVVRMVEEFDNFKRETQARCFILVLPKPVAAAIKGGNSREIGVKQTLILDGSKSRDFALSPNVLQDLFFRWDCISQDGQFNADCNENMGSASVLKIRAGNLQVNNTYNFTLSVNSKVNKLVFDKTYQTVKVMENSQLSIDIKCIRNCMRNEFIHGDLLHLKAVSFDGQFSKATIFKWTLGEHVIGERAQLIYFIKENDQMLNIRVAVVDQTLSGQAHETFKVNPPPVSGSCAIEPHAGEAARTNFHIKCENYLDKDVPLSYDYIEENGFTLRRTNEKEIYTTLPPCSAVLIRVCDQFQACIENNLKVRVEDLKAVQDLRNFLKQQESGLARHLETGDILTGMILLKSLTKFVKTIDDVADMMQEMKKFNIKTLLQVEQFLEISRDLVRYSVPLSAEKAHVFNKYLAKLLQGLKTIVKDDEITTFKRLSYEKSYQELLEIMEIFSQTWENIPTVQIQMPQTILSSNPLIESTSQLSDFDITVAEQLESWLSFSRTLHNCLSLVVEGAKKLYAPGEDIFSIENNNLSLQMYAFDNGTQQDIKFSKTSINITLNEACVGELQEIYYKQAILIQAGSLNSNPFWWYPSERPVNSDVFFLSAFGSASLKVVEDLKTPFGYELKLKANNYSLNEVLGHLNSSSHMPLYSIELPANSLLVIIFLHAKEPFKFLLKINKLPKSFEVLKSGIKVDKGKGNKTFVFMNPYNRQVPAYMATLLSTQCENVTFSFHTEIRECLYWDFSLNDPQWSSQGCKPKLEVPHSARLTCFCQHFSVFAARSYQPAIREHLKETRLLTELPINWYMVAFYISLIIVFAFILLLNYYQSIKKTEFLPTTSASFLNNDIELCIFTGHHWNATSSANITLRMISQKGSFSLTIIQNPENPFLRRNSMCRLLVSSQHVDIPLKLIISNDQSGRYSSWYCHKIIARNLKTQQTQIFLIAQWISQKELQISETPQNKRNFSERLRHQVSEIYINWFQFQPLWGCWLYNDLNRLERCSLELSYLIGSVCFVACYFGRTTMETYEAERELYYFLNFNIVELLYLSSVCYLINFIMKLIFSGGTWLLHVIYVKLNKTKVK